MSQSYFPSRQASSSNIATSNLMESHKEEKSLRVEDIQGAYLEKKDRLILAIDSTKSILHDLREFNKSSWVVRYPQLHAADDTVGGSTSAVDDRSSNTDVTIQPSTPHSAPATLEDVSKPQDKSIPEEEPLPDFHILRLDLKLGTHGSSSGPSSLVAQLEKSSIANLLDERIVAAMKHVDKLRSRVEDTSSKVLVTGDLNSGKSTFVNALLRRPVMPVDQQPCTTMFCEVHDAAENGGVEEVHIVKEGATYDIKNQSTYTRSTLSELEIIVGENENVQQMVRIYITDARRPAESLLHNGIVDIALIDAPGLNRDSLKTTALFARQEEIDVVVFVVSAENHFTLSAKEFLWNASNEKAYLFIVVNRFDQIRDKERCKRLVLEQIKQLSPRTYDDAEDLVHFVDSSSSQLPTSASVAFDRLESSLRSFVLVKRTKSKLHPASTYLSHILSDVDLLAKSNSVAAETELRQARDDLSRARPVLEKMKSGRDELEDSLETVEESGATKASAKTKEVLNMALERVGKGELGVEKGMTMPTYPGLFGIWDYARDVRKALLASLDMAVQLAQDEARLTTSAGVKQIATLGEEYLPAGVERSKRVFMPERMFSPKKGGRTSHSTVVAGGMHGLGIGLAQRPEMLEVTFFDIFDVRHHFSVHFGDDSKMAENDNDTPTALSVVSVGIGALTMVGGKTLGARGIIDGIVRISDLLGNETVRKWAAPVVGAITIGLTAYFILELPTSIPRTIGRRIRVDLVQGAEEDQDTLYVNAHSTRVARETRKVLRLASWDLRERFRAAMDERGREVRNAEEVERKAAKALEWFTEVAMRASDVRTSVSLK